MRVVCVDGGSSSLKLGTCELDSSGERAIDARSLTLPANVPEVVRALEASGKLPDAVGHRIVFGGRRARPVLATPALLDELAGYENIDPLHLPAQLKIVRSIAAAHPALPQVLCFDTAFHRTMPDVAARYPLPSNVDPLVRRYGYHGLSYEYIVSTFDAARYRRAVVAHLGNGASLAAVLEGQGIDTTMGFSPLGGLMMGTRAGDLDPAVVLYLLRSGSTVQRLSDLFGERSGLRGVSARSHDMQTLVEAMPEDAASKLAVTMYAYIAAKFVGAMVAALGGLDLLIFTGGIGENASVVRAMICERLGSFFGIAVDEARNAAGSATISGESSRVEVRVTPTNETLMIARHACVLLSAR